MDFENYIFSVSEIFDLTDGLVKGVGIVKVSAEVSSVSNHAIGVFMSLRDKEGPAVLKIYIPKAISARLKFNLEVGLRVIVSGRLSLYRPRSEMSLIALGVEIEGEGDLHAEYTKLAQKLESEGLFARKRELPETIQKIALVTSGHGAVLADFVKNLPGRGVELLLIPTRVEGVTAIGSILNSLRIAYSLKVDMVVLMRGGGSFEDLLPFSDESVVRLVAACPVPILAAIGHDKDMPLVCFAADVFTSTPTAAAVLVGEKIDLRSREIREVQTRLAQLLSKKIEQRQRELQRAVRTIENRMQKLTHLLERYTQKLSVLITECVAKQERLLGAINLQFLNTLKVRSDAYKSILNLTLAWQKLVLERSPETQLKRGFALVWDEFGNLVKTTKSLQVGHEASLQLVDGQKNIIIK